MDSVELGRHRELVEDINDAVYTVDVNTLVFTSVNEAGEKLTGYSKKELLNMPISKIIVPDYLPIVQKMIKRKRNNKSTIYEIEILSKDGAHVPIEISSKALYDESGKPVEILGVARDMTERKLIERQRDVFISILTHEIKNPLTSVGLYSTLLQKVLAKEGKAYEYVESIRDQVDTINHFMADFLDASQMRVGKFRLYKDKVDLNEVIDDVMQVCKVTTHKFKKKADIKKPVAADRTRIKQVLINLVSNAIKYSPGSKSVIIKAEDSPKEVTISVQDFGSGISKKEQRHIFDLFVRTGFAYRSNIQGHGLGLYISREIVRRHKGRIWVESTVGKGSTFSFTIPRKA